MVVSKQKGYRGHHSWVQRNFGKANKCDFDTNHQASVYHWSNKSGEYLRERIDWQKLCPKCHWEYDRASHVTKTQCSEGHLFDDSNTHLYTTKEGKIWRKCKICRLNNLRKYKEKIREQR